MSVDVIAPSAGESVTEIEISKWEVSDGVEVEKDQVIAIAETEKATLEIRSPVSGKLKILTSAGSVVSPGTPVGSVDETVTVSSKLSSSNKPSANVGVTQDPIPSISANPPTPEVSSLIVSKTIDSFENVSSKSTDDGPIPVYASPSVRRMIVEKNVDISQLLQSHEGRSPLTEKDVENFLNSRPSKDSGSSTAREKEERLVKSRKMTRLRQTIAKRLVMAQHGAALLTTFNEIDMGEVVAIRNQYKELFKQKHEVGLGFMSFFIKAVCQALKEFPIINSRIEEDTIVEHQYVDIGIAVATPKGLVVPVIRNAESLNFKKIEEIITNYGRKGKEGSIPMDDLTGGTFTITNGGTFGSMLSTPIINPPQSGILGMHNIVERPVVKDGAIVIRPVMYVALTYDHRLIDGADSVSFLYRIKELIEDPNRLLVGV